MYDVTNRESFESVKKMLEAKNKFYQVFLVGNKCDLKPHFDKKVVQEFCDKHNIKNLEVSSIDKTSVKNAMMSILQGLKHLTISIDFQKLHQKKLKFIPM